jgi:hypothetical protein
MSAQEESQRPIAPVPQWENLPAAFALHMWVVWKRLFVKGHWTKVLYQTNGEPASSSDPSTWCSYPEAKGAYLRVNPFGGHPFSGVGVVVSDADPFVFFDFDDAVEDGKIVKPTVERYVQMLDSYTELSVSGKGLHVFVKGKLPPEFRRHPDGYEMYDHHQFATMTGNLWTGTPRTVNPRQAAVDAIHSEVFAVKIAAREAYRSRESATPVGSKINLDNTQLLDRARHAANGAKFIKLFDEGDIADFDSHSEADASLMAALAFWTCCDASRMDLLFRESALVREKWEKRQDYRTSTIRLAIEGCENPYTGEIPPLDLPLIVNGTVHLVGDAAAAAMLRAKGAIAAHVPIKHWHKSHTKALLCDAVTIYVGEPGGMPNDLAVEAKNALASQMLALPRVQQKELRIRITVPEGFESWTDFFERGM